MKKQIEKKNKLTLVPVGGLANRMKAIDAAVALVQEADMDLHILWFKDKGLNCRFDQLFQPFSVPNITIKEADWLDKILFDRPRKKNFHIPRLFQKLLFKASIYEQEATQLFYKGFDFLKWAKDRRCYLASCVYFRPQQNHPLFSIFRPVEEVQKHIDACCQNFNQSTIGIHIRRTDNIASIQQSPTELFIKRIEMEIAKDTNCHFYLATDSEEEKEKLKGLFGKRIIASPHIADRNSLSGMQDALTELYVLSKTKKILGSMQSSYSETAAQIGNIHCELLKKKP